MSENAIFAHDLQVNFERILTAYETATDGLSRKVRQLLAEVRMLKDENGRLKAECQLKELEHK